MPEGDRNFLLAFWWPQLHSRSFFRWCQWLHHFDRIGIKCSTPLYWEGRSHLSAGASLNHTGTCVRLRSPLGAIPYESTPFRQRKFEALYEFERPLPGGRIVGLTLENGHHPTVRMRPNNPRKRRTSNLRSPSAMRCRVEAGDKFTLYRTKARPEPLGGTKSAPKLPTLRGRWLESTFGCVIRFRCSARSRIDSTVRQCTQVPKGSTGKGTPVL